MTFYKIEKNELRMSDLAVFARLYTVANDVCNGAIKSATIPLSADYNGVKFENAITIESIQCVFYALHSEFKNLGFVSDDETDCNGHVYKIFKLVRLDSDYNLTVQEAPKRLKKRPSSATVTSGNSEKTKTDTVKTGTTTESSKNTANNKADDGNVQSDVITCRFDVTDMVGEISKLAQNYGKFELKKLREFETELFKLFEK